MENFLSKKDILLVEERAKIIKKKYGNYYKKNKFIDNIEEIRSYVRIQYSLGEPCWGRNSPINNFIHNFK